MAYKAVGNQKDDHNENFLTGQIAREFVRYLCPDVHEDVAVYHQIAIFGRSERPDDILLKIMNIGGILANRIG